MPLNRQYTRALTSANVLTGARLAHPSGDKSAAENLRRKDPTFKSSSAIAKHISGKQNPKPYTTSSSPKPYTLNNELNRQSSLTDACHVHMLAFLSLSHTHSLSLSLTLSLSLSLSHSIILSVSL